MLARTLLVLVTWSYNGEDTDRVVSHGVGYRGRGESRLARSEALLLEISPAFKDIKTAGKWERGAMRGEEEGMVGVGGKRSVRELQVCSSSSSHALRDWD